MPHQKPEDNFCGKSVDPKIPDWTASRNIPNLKSSVFGPQKSLKNETFLADLWSQLKELWTHPLWFSHAMYQQATSRWVEKEYQQAPNAWKTKKYKHQYPNQIIIIIIIIYLFIYDRNSNLNSHTRIFWGFRGSNPHPHRGVGLYGEGDYHWTECLSSNNNNS